MVTTVATVTILSSGVAVAFWAAAGAGSGTAKAGTATPLTTVTATASTTSLLYPGGLADVKVTVRNPNPYPVSITSVAANGAVTAATGIGTCATTGVSLATPTAGLPFTVPARAAGVDGSNTVTLTNGAQMTNASDTGCQDATFTIPLTMTGAGS